MPAGTPSQPRQDHHHTNTFTSTDDTVTGCHNFLRTTVEISSAAQFHACPSRHVLSGSIAENGWYCGELVLGEGKHGIIKVNGRTALERYASKETFDDAVSGRRDIRARASVTNALIWRRAICGHVSTRLALSVFQLPDMGIVSTRTGRADEARTSKLLVSLKCPWPTLAVREQSCLSFSYHLTLPRAYLSVSLMLL